MKIKNNYLQNNYRVISLLLCLLFVFGVANNAVADNVNKLVDECADCHGKDGNSTDGKSPNIAGGSIDYFVDAMNEYKSGDRPSMKLSSKKKDMQDEAKGLSDQDIDALAGFYAKQKYIPWKQKFDPELATAGKKLHRKYCEICHSEGGSSAEDDSGILAGQPLFYLQYVMDSYASGKREMGRMMRKKFKSIQKKAGDEGMSQLIHYYASQQ